MINNYEYTNVTKELKNTLISIGFIPNLKGYKFICTAVILTLEDNSLIDNVTSSLYPKVASFYGEKTASIERNIRHAIKVAYNSKKIYEINNVFSSKILSPKEKPTSSQLIALLVEKMFISIL